MKKLLITITLLLTIALSAQEDYTFHEIPFNFQDISTTGDIIPFPQEYR